MSEYVFISIPRSIARRAEELARARKQPIDTIIAELLEQGLPAVSPGESVPDDSTFSIGREREYSMAQETVAYEAMHAELFGNYPGEYVAIYQQELVDHDADETALLNRIDARFPNKIVLLKRVGTLPEPDLRIHSPWPQRSYKVRSS